MLCVAMCASRRRGQTIQAFAGKRVVSVAGGFYHSVCLVAPSGSEFSMGMSCIIIIIIMIIIITTTTTSIIIISPLWDSGVTRTWGMTSGTWLPLSWAGGHGTRHMSASSNTGSVALARDFSKLINNPARSEVTFLVENR